jgi:flagellar biosynthesis/type III secretory pathway protein FliH
MALIKHANVSALAREAVVLDLGDLARQGEAILAQARKRAEQVVAEAQAERARLMSGAAEEGRQAGFAEGLERGAREGAERGYAEAVAERREALGALEQRWTAALDALSADRDRLMSDARRDVIVLACKLASLVTHRMIQQQPGVVADQLTAVLELVLRPTRLAVAIHPEDRPVVEAALPGLVRKYANATHVDLVEDAGLERGSVVARLADGGAGGSGGGGGGGGGGEIDASIGTQLERIAEALLPEHRPVEGAA